MKDILKTFGIAFAYATGIMAGMCAAPKLVEKVCETTKKLTNKNEN